MKTPNHFQNKSSMASVFQKREHEIIASNIMTILARTENSFRDLSWEEYKSERLKDSNFSENEKYYFNEVIPYFKSEDTVRLFCPGWKNV